MRTLVALAASLLLAGCTLSDSGPEPEGSASRTSPTADAAPPPNEPLPRAPGSLAARLTQTERALQQAIDRWRAEGDTAAGTPPRPVVLLALHQQRIHLLLTARERLARRVLARLPARVAASARTTIVARRGLGRITPPARRRRFRTGPAEPAGVLLRHYREAQRRFGVAWPVLAAVNFVESAFGRLRNESSAGAQGPMQFIPSTWKAYGMGGDVHDPRDAILGAANYLHANGAPGDYRLALYHYNPASAYVNAILGFARQIRRDPRAYFGYYSWQVFVRTPSGVRRITGPGM
jgi:membrane-bound lytic murein transglycosylase B